MENNLEIDVRKAKELGLSYGQYKALTYNPNAVPVKKAETSKPCPVCVAELLNRRDSNSAQTSVRKSARINSVEQKIKRVVANDYS